LSLVPFLPPSGQAAPDTNGYQANDLLLYFRNPVGNVNNGRVIAFSLGSTWDVFRRAATPGDPTANSVIYLGNINSFLADGTTPPLATPSATGGYGADWTGLSSSIWVGAAGNKGSTSPGSTNTSDQDYARTLYLTKPRTGAGTIGIPNSSLTDNLATTTTTFQGATASAVSGIGSVFVNEMINDVPRSVANANSTIDDQNPITSGVAGKAFNNFVTGGTMGQISSSTYTYGSISNVVIGLDLYRQTPVLNASGWQNINSIAGVEAGKGYYLGTITLSSSGDVNFVPRTHAAPAVDDYTTWTTNFPTATLTNKEADFDNDGFKNVAEYAFNTDPTKGNASLTTATVVSSNLVVSFQQRTGPTNLVPTYTVLTATNLSVAFTTNSTVPFSTNTAVGYELRSVTNPVSGGRGFYRIQATLPPAN
jgi:hypothetical protein